MMTVETIYNGKVLYTDYYMTRSQWEKQFHRNAKQNLKRNLKRYIKRKSKVFAQKTIPFFYAGIAVCGLVVAYTVIGIMASVL